MNRRTILKYAAYTTGVVVSAPLVSTFLAGCKTEPAAPPYVPTFLTAEEYKQLTAVADTMLPKTNTPSASEVGVPAFVDTLLGKYVEVPIRDKVRSGMNEWLKKAAPAEGKTYADLEETERLALLNTLDAESKVELEALETMTGLTPEEFEMKMPWFQDLKGMIIGGYFGSKIVGTEVLNYLPVPGDYKGCIPLSEVGTAWSL